MYLLPQFAMTRRRAVVVALAVLTLGAMAAAWPLLDSMWEAYKFARWQEREIAWFQGDGFGTLTPKVHYDWAIRLLRPQKKKVLGSGKYAVSVPWTAEPSTEAVKNAIRHLEAIPAESDVYARAARLLPLLRIKRDRPPDFPAAEEASFRSCMAKVEADQEAEAQIRPCRGIVDPKTGKCVI